MERTHQQYYGSMRQHGSDRRPIGGSYGYEAEALDYGPPSGGERGRRFGRRRRPGMIRRMAHWVGSTLQDWAETGAEQLARAGERARELTEEGGARAQGMADRGEREARHWTRRAGARMEDAGERMEGYGEQMRGYGRPGYGPEAFGYGRGRAGYGPQAYGYGQERLGYQHGGHGMEAGQGHGFETGYGMSGQPGFGFGERTGQAGPFAGRGPRGYQRSDERIHEEVCDLLSQGFIDAGDVDVKVENGEVTLQGEVRQRDWKRLAEDMAADVRGVRDVHNELRVRRQEPEEAGQAPRPETYHSEQDEAEPRH